MKHVAKAEWVTVGSKRFYAKSQAEALFARYLQFLEEQGSISQWLYEPETFWFLEIKRGVRSYKPDFKVSFPDGSHVWFEVKGYMDAKSKTKLKRFSKYYPLETLRVVKSGLVSRNSSTLRELVLGDGSI